jgi:hypothetical protein
VWAAFPLTRLRPEQVVGSLLQAASVTTIDHQSSIVVRAARALGQAGFVEQYGDTGQDEFGEHGGTIPQRLVLMNGELVKQATQQGLGNASSQIARFAPDDETAVEAAYLSVLSRRPSPEERAHFAARLAGTRGGARAERMEDLCWCLINSTEFSWNH